MDLRGIAAGPLTRGCRGPLFARRSKIAGGTTFMHRKSQPITITQRFILHPVPPPICSPALPRQEDRLRMTAITWHLALLSVCLLGHRSAAAFQQPISAPIAAAPSSARRSCSPRATIISSAARSRSEEEPFRDDGDHGRIGNAVSRRGVLARAMYGAGLTFAASGCNALDVPGFLVSAEVDRGVKGMPVPGKKVGGLSKKITSVSKIMVRING